MADSTHEAKADIIINAMEAEYGTNFMWDERGTQVERIDWRNRIANALHHERDEGFDEASTEWRNWYAECKRGRVVMTPDELRLRAEPNHD